MGNTATKSELLCLLVELDGEELKNYIVGLIGAGLDDGFYHMSKLHVMKYKAAMNGPNSKKLRTNINE